MTRRERLERKMQRRREWADKAEARSTAAYNTAHKIGDMIPPGQPILIGHHSEKRHRRDLDRIDSNMRKSIGNTDLAQSHDSKADSIQDALDRSIYSDDNNAIEALEARIKEREEERARMTLANRLYRKGDAAGLAALGLDYEKLKAEVTARPYSWENKAPFVPYQLSNLGGRITADRKRLEYLKRDKQHRDAAQASPTGVVLQEHSGGYCSVTFAEKPSREILNALRGAAFHWGHGSWTGKTEALPESVKQLLNKEVPIQ